MFEILQIEPNAALRAFIERLVHSEHINLIQTSHMVGGLDYILHRQPHLVICNYRLHEQTALHLQARLIMLQRPLPVMALCGREVEEADRAAMLRIGIAAIHPLDEHPNNLRRSINRLLEAEALPTIKLVAEPEKRREAEASLPCG